MSDKMITVELADDDLNDWPESAVEFMDKLIVMLDSVPKEFLDSATIEFDDIDTGDYHATIKIEYQRSQTKEELKEVADNLARHRKEIEDSIRPILLKSFLKSIDGVDYNLQFDCVDNMQKFIAKVIGEIPEEFKANEEAELKLYLKLKDKYENIHS